MTKQQHQNEFTKRDRKEDENLFNDNIKKDNLSTKNQQMTKQLVFGIGRLLSIGLFFFSNSWDIKRNQYLFWLWLTFSFVVVRYGRKAY